MLDVMLIFVFLDLVSLLMCKARPPVLQVSVGTDRPCFRSLWGPTDRGPMHRPRAVSGGPNIGRFKPVGPKFARPGTSLFRSLLALAC